MNLVPASVLTFLYLDILIFCNGIARGVRLAFYHKSVLISIHIVFYVIVNAFPQVIQWAYIQASLRMLVVYLLIVVYLPYSRSTAMV